jgi:hypothetical protein
MTDPRHPTGPGNSQPGLQPQRAPGLHPPHQVTPGLHPAPQPTHSVSHATPGLHPNQQPQRSAPMVAPAAPRPAPAPVGDEPIALVEELLEDDLAATTPKKIKAFGEDGSKKHHDWKRKATATGQGACRMRSFHGKYSDQGLQYLDDAVNEWLDANPDVEVKFVTSTVGVFEGKIREPALVLNLWY